MNLTVSGQQIDVGEALREHVGRALDGAVSKYFDDALEGVVRFGREAHLFRADISVHVGRNIQMQSHGAASDIYMAFDVACEHIAKRLRRHKRRLRDYAARAHREGEAATAATQSIIAAPVEPDEAAPTAGEATEAVVIAEMKTAIETFSVGEAVVRLDLTGQPALMFRNRANGLLNMVYRRTDGNIGWVDPQNMRQ